MQQPNPNQATPYKVEQDKPERSYEVLPDGNVKMTEVTTTVAHFAAREMRTFLRQHETDMDAIEKQFGEAHQKKLADELELLKKDHEGLKPVVEEAEEKAKAQYEKMKAEGDVKKLKETLAKEGFWKDNGLMSWAWAAWQNFSDDQKEQFDSDEKATIVKLLRKQKEAERRSKKG